MGAPSFAVRPTVTKPSTSRNGKWPNLAGNLFREQNLSAGFSAEPNITFDS
jgi:hypothetical protein